MVSKEELIEKNLYGQGQNLRQGCTTTCSVSIPEVGFDCKNPKLECPDLSAGDTSGHFKYYAEIKGVDIVKATITVTANGEQIGKNSKTHDTHAAWWDFWTMCGAPGPFDPRCHMDVSFNRAVKPGEKVEATLSFTKS